MKIIFKLFATLQDYLPAEARRTSTVNIEVVAGTTVSDVIQRYALPEELCHLVLVDGLFLPSSQWASRILREGEVLAIWPPVAGG